MNRPDGYEFPKHGPVTLSGREGDVAYKNARITFVAQTTFEPSGDWIAEFTHVASRGFSAASDHVSVVDGRIIATFHQTSLGVSLDELCDFVSKANRAYEDRWSNCIGTPAEIQKYNKLLDDMFKSRQ